MTRVSEFDTFYVSSRSRILCASYALCGDVAIARNATLEAYARAWRQWDKVRGGDPASFVRDEASKLFVVSRGTRLLRRDGSKPADPGLHRALGKLSFDERRLIILLTVAQLDLVDATKEMSIDEEAALETTSLALEKLESELKVPIDDLESRLTGLTADLVAVNYPSADRLRSGAIRGGKRNLALLVAGCSAVLVAGGFVATHGPALSSAQALPNRQQLGAERPPTRSPSLKLTATSLLTAAQVSTLDPAEKWTIEGTSTDAADKTPYSTCPPRRFADPNPSQVFVQVTDTADAHQRVAQSIEVSRSGAASRAAYQRLLSWYAGCSHPRTTLIDSFTVKRSTGDFHILRLQSYRQPERFISVGLAQSGTMTSTVVHEDRGTTPTSVARFASLLDTSMRKACTAAGLGCAEPTTVVASVPPPTISDPSFLSVVDLPPVGDIDRAWAANAATASVKQNPSASPCDNSDFSGWTNARTKLFVFTQATHLPDTFAVAQTVADAASPDDATKAVATISAKMRSCSKSKVAGKVTDTTTIKGDGFTGTSWRMTFALSAKQKVAYRMGVVRRANHVTQVLFPPAGTYDLSNASFVALVKRAGERLSYAN